MLTFLHSGVLRIIGVAATVSIFLLLLTLLGLLSDTGRVSTEAETQARAELARYLDTHPDQRARTLAVVDYRKPSWTKRMVIIDLQSGFRSFYRVAHGKNSGERFAIRFSDVPESNMSSLGLFRVTRVYFGDHGRSLRLEGLDSLRNGNAALRDIVLHSAGYVSIRYILLNLLTGYGPMIGRSSGCFAVSRKDIGEVAGKLVDGGFIYAWVGSNDNACK
ncbi:MAG: murein L,D-transpeptidase catalytic domain family protein [Chlorobiaceae bacterium]|nr:murein L,D-transpeptidase catalytic domain family protein [Chlorobiaceae bacterium]